MNWHRAMYDEEFANQSINSVRFHELAINEVNFLTSYLQLRPGMKLLDVPCGAGRHAKYFARNGMSPILTVVRLLIR
jgi:cyclopropane fatty-acyl-phospholipid synthase-like methyltransferase